MNQTTKARRRPPAARQWHDDAQADQTPACDQQSPQDGSSEQGPALPDVDVVMPQCPGCGSIRLRTRSSRWNCPGQVMTRYTICLECGGRFRVIASTEF